MSQPRNLVLRPEYRALQQGQGGQGGGQDTSFVPREQAGPETGTKTEGGPAGGTQPPPAMCGTEQMLMILAMVAIFYFLLIRPQQKQEKARRAMLGAIKEGDKVVTSGGIHGTISSLNEHTVKLRVDGQIKLTIDRQNIGRIGGEPPPPDKKG